MTRKTVSFAVKPVAANPDAWVEKRHEEPKGKMKRLTLDLPAELHGRIKARCAVQGRPMLDAIREILEREFPA